MKIIERPYTAPERAEIRELLRNETGYDPGDAVFDRLIDLGQRRQYDRKELVVTEGEVDDNIYIIVKGVLRAWHNDEGNDVTSAFGLPGTILQVFSCYCDRQPSPDSYETCSKAELLCIPHDDFDALIHDCREFSLWVLQLCFVQLKQFEIRRKRLRGDAFDRYNTLVRERDLMSQNIPLKVIASYLGITPQYLSAIRARAVRAPR